MHININVYLCYLKKKRREHLLPILLGVYGEMELLGQFIEHSHPMLYLVTFYTTQMNSIL
jgi:hypothetical protein